MSSLTDYEMKGLEAINFYRNKIEAQASYRNIFLLEKAKGMIIEDLKEAKVKWDADTAEEWKKVSDVGDRIFKNICSGYILHRNAGKDVLKFYSNGENNYEWFKMCFHSDGPREHFPEDKLNDWLKKFGWKISIEESFCRERKRTYFNIWLYSRAIFKDEFLDSLDLEKCYEIRK